MMRNIMNYNEFWITITSVTSVPKKQLKRKKWKRYSTGIPADEAGHIPIVAPKDRKGFRPWKPPMTEKE
jgi:hypothetical protein